VEPAPDMSAPASVDNARWQLQATIRHPVDAGESVLLFRRR